MKKRLLSLCLVLLLLAAAGPLALALVDKSPDYYVADYAGVLSAATKQTIISTNAALENSAHNAQIVVVTAQSLGGMYADEYANQLFNNWGVGSAEENNGMLLLLATGEGKAWLATGAGVSDTLTDDDVDSLLNDYFWTDFDRGDFDAAVGSLFPRLVAWYENYYGVSIGGSSGSAQNPPGAYQGPQDYGGYDGRQTGPARSESSGFNSGGYLIVMLVLLILVLMLIDRGRYRRYYTYMGTPIPRYGFYTFFLGGPYRSWRSGPRGPGGRGGPGGFGGGTGPRPPGGSGFSGRSPGGFGGRSSGGGGGRGSFGGRSSGGGGHSGGGGGGRR